MDEIGMKFPHGMYMEKVYIFAYVSIVQIYSTIINIFINGIQLGKIGD